MRIHAFQADTGGSGFYRITEPIRAVLELNPGHRITYSTDIDVDAIRHPAGWEPFGTPNQGLYEVTEVKHDCDLLVVQRPLSQGVNATVRAAKNQGMKICVDLDDDFHNVHPDNVAASSTDPKNDPLHNRNWLMDTLKYVDWVTVSTPALLKYAPVKDGVRRGSVVRNYLPERVQELTHETPWSRNALRVGWTGTVDTHPQDISRARGVMSQSPELSFFVVGHEARVAQQLGLPSDRVHLASDWTVTVEAYWAAINDSIDIGIAPLETSKFNKAKSWLKCIEYAALGIPFLASPLPEYQLIQRESGAGEIASGQAQWAKKLRTLIDDYDRYSKNGIEWTRENTLEKHVTEWTDAWEQAMQ